MSVRLPAVSPLMLLLLAPWLGAADCGTVGDSSGKPNPVGDDTALPTDDTAAPSERPGSLSQADAGFVGAPSTAAGSAVAGPGDLDGDGLADVVVTAFYGNLACVWYGPVAPGDHAMADADACLLGEGVYDFAGYAAAGAGDVDGDGVADLMISAGGNDEGGADAGKVYLFTDPLPAGTSSFDAAPYGFTGEAAGDYAGVSLAPAGDVNADGLADLLVGASGNDAGGGGAGRVYLLRGPFTPGTTSLALAQATFTGTSATPPAFAHGASTGGDALGDAIAGLGDIDGDGFDDLLLGGSGSDDNGTDSGAAWVIHGPVSDGDHVAADADVRLFGPTGSAFAGGSVAGPGDLDGDGLRDLVVSADGAEGGRVYVMLSPLPDGTSALSDAGPVLVGDADELAGWSVAGAGDVNADGTPDLLVGAPGNDVGAADGGGAYVVMDAATTGVRTLSETAWLLAGEAASDAAGRAVAGAGDVDGDGAADLLIGALYNQDGGVFAGKGYLVRGVVTDR